MYIYIHTQDILLGGERQTEDSMIHRFIGQCIKGGNLSIDICFYLFPYS